MKKYAALIIILQSMYGCASNLSKNVGKDYIAEGNTNGIEAFIYAHRTVIEFDKEPSFAYVMPPIVSITDDKDRTVSYERVGRFYRLPRALLYYKIRVNGKLTIFTYNPQSSGNLAFKSIY